MYHDMTIYRYIVASLTHAHALIFKQERAKACLRGFFKSLCMDVGTYVYVYSLNNWVKKLNCLPISV